MDKKGEADESTSPRHRKPRTRQRGESGDAESIQAALDKWRTFNHARVGALLIHTQEGTTMDRSEWTKAFVTYLSGLTDADEDEAAYEAEHAALLQTDQHGDDVGLWQGPEAAAQAVMVEWHLQGADVNAWMEPHPATPPDKEGTPDA
jgi:hypothetical protein